MVSRDEISSRVTGCLRSPKTPGTILYALSFAFLGLALSSMGPILAALADQTGVELADVG